MEVAYNLMLFAQKRLLHEQVAKYYEIAMESIARTSQRYPFYSPFLLFFFFYPPLLFSFYITLFLSFLSLYPCRSLRTGKMSHNFRFTNRTQNKRQMGHFMQHLNRYSRAIFFSPIQPFTFSSFPLFLPSLFFLFDMCSLSYSIF